MMRAIAILNAKAGLCLQHGEGIEHVVSEAFRAGGNDIEVSCVEPSEIANAIEQAAARTDIDTLIVGGGDGTQSLAASKLAGREIALGVLPFGTVNLLGRDLGIPLELEDAVKALAKAERTAIDLAEVNGRLFHSLLGLGFFARMANERQRARRQFPFARAAAFVVAWVRAVLRVDAMSVTFEVDGKVVTRRSAAVLVTNNRYGEESVKRARLDAGVLEINVVRGGSLRALLRAGVDLAAGAWRRGDAVEQFAAREITIHMRRPRVHVSLDGERVLFNQPLIVKMRPRALTVLRPREA
jgi:diacylglycerol kinase family enzyme